MRRFARIQWEGQARWVEFLEEDAVQLLSDTPDLERAWYEQELDKSAIKQFVYLPPCAGSKVLGLAYNYKSLVGAKEAYEEPLFFFKSPTSLCGHGATVAYPAFADMVWVEVELAIVVKKHCRNVTADEAGDYILGYSIASDITARNIHGRDHHLARSKALDQFAPIGPYLVTGLDTSNLTMTTHIDGQEFQRGNTDDRILGDNEAVSLLSRYITLEPGDVILTGTPAGAMDSVVRPGNKVSHRIEQLGELEFSIG